MKKGIRKDVPRELQTVINKTATEIQGTWYQREELLEHLQRQVWTRRTLPVSPCSSGVFNRTTKTEGQRSWQHEPSARSTISPTALHNEMML